MKDIIAQLYNGFLLRDLLGYIVPGAFVLGCVVHLLSVITDTPYSTITAAIPDKILSYLFLICLCYVCGHFLSGIFFHTAVFKWIFSYAPDLLATDYPDMSSDKAWSTHRTLYKMASETIGISMQNHVERHAALLHFTGHVSASFLFIAVYICAFAVYSSNFRILTYLAPIVILFPGIFLHYKRLSIERYHLERAAIEAAAIGGKSTSD